MSGIALELDSITVLRSGRYILDVEKLRIPAGQFVNIIGTNGAGKTTLLKVLCGLMKPSSGEVFFDNIALTSLSSWNRTNLKKQIGYIPQSAEYNSELPFTVREVVVMGRSSAKRLFSGLTQADYDSADQWIERIGLAEQGKQTFRSLSGGEQQKTLIARAMVQNPKILMLDEPTSNLDFHWKGKISRLVKDLQKQMNLTVLMISHELTSIPIETDRTILLDNGKIIADGSSETVLTSEQIAQVYKCRINVCEINGSKYIINQDITKV